MSKIALSPDILISRRLISPLTLCATHTWYLLREPRVYPCKFFLAGVNFYRFNAKIWHFRQILREKWAFFFTDLTRKIGVFGVNFILQKFYPCKKNDKYQVWSYSIFLFSGQNYQKNLATSSKIFSCNPSGHINKRKLVSYLQQDLFLLLSHPFTVADIYLTFNCW